MVNRSTKITVNFCPVEDGEVDYDKDCDGCKYFLGMNKDYEVLCDWGRLNEQNK